MKKYIYILIVIVLAGILQAETSGEYGFQMLKISSGADGSAQAGVGAYTSSDAFAYIQNPSAALFNRGRKISIAQNYWIFDTKINSGSYSYSNGKSSFGAGYRYLDYGTIERRPDTGSLIGEYHPMDMVLSFNFGYRITPDHYAGVNLHALYEQIDSASALGAAFDLGYTFLTPIQNLKLNAAVKNLGKTSAMNEEVIELPISSELGLVYKSDFNFAVFSYEMKVIKHIDDDELRAIFGVKTEITKKLNLKLGYKYNYDVEGFTAGFGINLKKIAVDYAYVLFDAESEIDNVHVIGLTYKFE